MTVFVKRFRSFAQNIRFTKINSIKGKTVCNLPTKGCKRFLLFDFKSVPKSIEVEGDEARERKVVEEKDDE